MTTLSDYRAHPGFNQSTANQLLSRSPRHAWDYRNRKPGVDPDHSRDREVGTVTHALVLGVQSSDVVLVDFNDYRTKLAQEQRRAAEEAGKTPILAPDMARARRAATAVQEQLGEFGIALDGASEQVIIWDEDGLACKAALDHVCADGITILDVKTGEDANPKALTRRIIAQGYHVQAAAYTRALGAQNPEARGRIRFIDVFVETTGMIMVTPVEIAGSLLELGEQQWLRACRKWAECVDSGVWPGYTTRVLRPEAPAWALSDEEAAQAEG